MADITEFEKLEGCVTCLSVGGLEAQHEDRVRPVATSRQQRLLMAEQAAIGRMKPGLRYLPGGVHGVAKASRTHRGAGPQPRPRLNPHPRLGDHAERALRPGDQPLPAEGPAPEPGSRRVGTVPRGVTTRMASTNSSMCV